MKAVTSSNPLFTEERSPRRHTFRKDTFGDRFQRIHRMAAVNPFVIDEIGSNESGEVRLMARGASSFKGGFASGDHLWIEAHFPYDIIVQHAGVPCGALRVFRHLHAESNRWTQAET